MDVRDRFTYTSGLETTGAQPSRVDNAGTAGRWITVAASTLGSDSSTFSAAAQALAQTMQIPDLREDRIASLQQRIAAGNYQVPAQEVGDAILRNVAE